MEHGNLELDALIYQFPAGPSPYLGWKKMWVFSINSSRRSSVIFNLHFLIENIVALWLEIAHNDSYLTNILDE